jgi:hypothetical protein
VSVGCDAGRCRTSAPGPDAEAVSDVAALVVEADLWSCPTYRSRVCIKQRRRADHVYRVPPPTSPVGQGRLALAGTPGIVMLE